jgi:6-phosphogluconolactonase (cycloisomerase 2 family)
MPHSRSCLARISVLAVTSTVILALSASFAIAQTSGTVAYIYVSSNYSGSNNRVVGYAANATGELTQISGSPWSDNLSYLASNGSFLFGSTNIPNDNGKNIFSYRVESNGALKYIGATNIQAASSQNACNQAEDLLLDHTGSDLYVFVANADCNSEVAYQSFAVNKSTGLLNYLGVTVPNAFQLGHPLTMLADNDYAYASGIGAENAEICGYQKVSNGNLVDLNGGVCNSAFPGTVGQPSGSNGDFGIVSADPTNHLAASIVYTDASSGTYVGTKIETIAVDTSNGSQSTGSTYANMPETDTPASSVVMSPGGNLLAVGGSNGVQIFNFNPNGQATANTGLITTAPITAMYWDKSSHLYAISNADNALHVFTVTATGAREAPGSPYSIPRPVGLAGNSISTSGAACSAPTSDGVNVCSPVNGATVTSPVQMNAAATVSGGVYRFELWWGSTKLLSVSNSGIMDQSLSLAPGSYHLIFDARNSSGAHEYATRDITVK